MKQPIISVKNLSFSYDRDSPILRQLNIDFKSNECVSIIGSNGCGKTTLGFCLSGIIPNIIHGNIEGDIFIDKTNLKESTLNHKLSEIGYLFEDPDNQFITLRVKDEIEFGLRYLSYSPNKIKEKANHVIHRFHLNKLIEYSPNDLSMGQKQKVVLASIIALSPNIMILDEPGSTLDVIGQKELINFINKLKKEGVTFIVFSHNLEFVKKISDRIIGLKAGAIAFDKAIDKFRDNDYEELYILDKESVGRSSENHEGLDESILKFDKVIYKYPRKENYALNNVSFSVKKNEVLGVVGINGSGKSTFLLAATGLLKLSGGNISINNQKLSKLTRKERISNLGMVFQNPNHQIFSSSIYDELSFGLKNIEVDDHEISNRINKVREFFKLEHLEKDPHSLSYGWKKILFLACVVAMEPKIILMDEPELGLDLYFQRKFGNLLVKLKKTGKTIILATHDLNLVKRVCDRVLLIDEGKILCNGPVDKILPNIRKHYETKRQDLQRDD